jgi:hypothetical protein
MTVKTSLQQLMGGTSDVKESFIPSMSDRQNKSETERLEKERLEKEKLKNKDQKNKDQKNKDQKNKDQKNKDQKNKDPKKGDEDEDEGIMGGYLGDEGIIGGLFSDKKKVKRNAKDKRRSRNEFGSNTNALMDETQKTTTNSILVFVVHVIFAIIIAYIWCILGSNALFLITRSKNEKEYILPTYRYAPPYCITDNKNASYFSYGFPYNLMPRICTNNGIADVINTEKENVYLLDEVEQGGVGNGVSQALFNYLFNSVYGGLGQGARSLAQAFLNLFDTTDSGKADNENSWDNMEVAGGRKFLIFILMQKF